jgi:mannose-6-phosphate isomerase-like protein (cupin superfamily)
MDENNYLENKPSGRRTPLMPARSSILDILGKGVADMGSEMHPIDVRKLASGVTESYFNQKLTALNDHVVRLSVMTEPFYWHRHPDSDETFFVLEGELLIELEEQKIILGIGQMLTVPAGVVHKTSPVGKKSVNLTVERADLITEEI